MPRMKKEETKEVKVEEGGKQDEVKNHRPVNLYIYICLDVCMCVIPLLHSKPINANVIVKFLRLLLLVVVIVCF